MTRKDTRLSGEIRPIDQFLRAANLEAHSELVESYIPTSRALEVLRRLVSTMGTRSSGRSWSLTGPYGAGKSSFALFLRALLGPNGDAWQAATRVLSEADPALYERLLESREQIAGSRGFLLATTTCQQEPVAASVLRALNEGASRRWPKRKPAGVARALAHALDTRSARSIVDAATAIAGEVPILLILDEFGKVLEHFAARATDRADVADDLFVLQELAERAAGDRALPLFTFTLQHLAFDDYVRSASAQQRREWGKVQGRFEDVSFLESAEQSLRLVAGALDDRDMSAGLRKARQTWSVRAFERAREVGIANHIPGGAATLADCYPLHPVALLALPELCARLGQHGRTLFTFIASAEPGTLRSYLDTTGVPDDVDSMPALSIAGLYDFFAGSGQAMALSVGGSRWREIHERVREASMLDQRDQIVLKTVGLLNLLGNSLGLRASPDIIVLSLSDPTQAPDPEWRRRLDDLEVRGFLTFRSFADEYRLWQGSDVDLRGRVADAREQLRTTSAADLLARLHQGMPVIAGRHSQQVGMLRYFSVAFTDEFTRDLPQLDRNDPADGSLVFHVGPSDSLDALRLGDDARPVVLATSEDANRVRDAAVEVAAALAVLDVEEVLGDRVARRELQDRVSDARSRLAQTLSDVFGPTSSGVRFRALDPDGGTRALDGSQGLSRMLSDVCDDAYAQSPRIRNEMLGRRELTSQGAKARRELIEAMLERGDIARLGMSGYGPERAMYEAVLRHSGLHSEGADRWEFGRPSPGDSLLHTWGAIAQFADAASEAPASLDQLYGRLAAPPIGLKEGPIPVLLVAYLLHRQEDLAIYEDGTFQPSLTADLVERLVKAPQRFALKSFRLAGARGRILAATTEATKAVGVGGLRAMSAAKLRNQTVLAVAAPLLNLARSMPTLTKRTSRLTGRALAVRAALLEAREPDDLLLRDLPSACEMDTAAWRNPSAEVLRDYSQRLSGALDELRQTYERQLQEIGDLLATAFGRPADVPRLRQALQVRAEPLQGKVLNPKLQAFVFNLTDDSSDNAAWLGLIGLAITGKAVELWLDDDVKRFAAQLVDMVSSFQRVESLHFDAVARSSETPFTARRLTLTTPQGDETSRVVYYDDNVAASLQDLVREVLARAEHIVGGPHGRDGLTALLVDEVLQATPTSGASLLATIENDEGAQAIGS